MKKLLYTISSLMLLITVVTANAETPAVASMDKGLYDDIHALQAEWARIKYTLKDEAAQEKQIELLAKKANTICASYSGKAEPMIWEAIILSTQAGIKGGFGALGLVKKARDLLEKAEKINPAALDGSVYTSLGSLYYQVPGWPLGFGDDDKARAYLEQARSVNPNGIDPNYFYGDFLINQNRNEEAIKVLQHALRAPARPDRPIADKGRREEILQAIKKAQASLEDI